MHRYTDLALALALALTKTLTLTLTQTLTRTLIPNTPGGLHRQTPRPPHPRCRLRALQCQARRALSSGLVCAGGGVAWGLAGGEVGAWLWSERCVLQPIGVVSGGGCGESADE